MNEDIARALFIQSHHAAITENVMEMKRSIGKAWLKLLSAHGKNTDAVVEDGPIHQQYAALPLRMRMDTMSHFAEWLERYAPEFIPSMTLGEGQNAITPHYQCEAVRYGTKVHLGVFVSGSGVNVKLTFELDELIGMMHSGFDYHSSNPLFFTL